MRKIRLSVSRLFLAVFLLSILIESSDAAKANYRSEADHASAADDPADDSRIDADATRPPFPANHELSSREVEREIKTFDVAEMDGSITKELQRAWAVSANGTTDVEGLVLVYRMADGSFRAVAKGKTNQVRSFTFKWSADVVAIIHTHPNDRDPKPAPEDIQVANRLGVPVFTITTRGMFMYDPATRKTTKVLNNLDWLDAGKWEEKLYARRGSSRGQIAAGLW